jgi:4-hydroxythreonine-4-phosphate dehydrogenase
VSVTNYVKIVSDTNYVPVLAVTLGDVRGIGPEVAAKACASRDERSDTVPLLIGMPGAFLHALELIGASASGWKSAKPSSLSPELTGFDELEVSLPSSGADALGISGTRNLASAGGRPADTPEAEAGRLAGKSIELAVSLAMKRMVSAIVTAPLDKKALNLGGYRYPGHTEMLKALSGAPSVGMMLVGGSLRVTLATIHVPFTRILEVLTPSLLLEQIALTRDALRNHFAIANPVIGLCALNPHAGEGGTIGDEEGKLLLPVVREAASLAIDVRGPLSADTIFLSCMAGDLDAVVALYHDQGMIAIKVHAFTQGVNLTIGLPFVRTSPAHGTAPDRAWKGTADASSMREAISLAEKLTAFDKNPTRD